MLEPKKVAQELFDANPRAAKREVDEYARSKHDDDAFVLQVYVHYFLLRGDRKSDDEK